MHDDSDFVYRFLSTFDSLHTIIAACIFFAFILSSYLKPHIVSMQSIRFGLNFNSFVQLFIHRLPIVMFRNFVSINYWQRTRFMQTFAWAPFERIHQMKGIYKRSCRFRADIERVPSHRLDFFSSISSSHCCCCCCITQYDIEFAAVGYLRQRG